MVGKNRRSLPPGKEYVGHCGRKAQLRYLKQRFSASLKYKDEASLAAKKRMHEVTAHEDEQFHAMLILNNLAFIGIEEVIKRTGQQVSWAESLEAVLDAYEKEKPERKNPQGRESSGEAAGEGSPDVVSEDAGLNQHQ